MASIPCGAGGRGGGGGGWTADSRVGPRLIDTFGLSARIDWGEAILVVESWHVLKRALVEGVRFLPRLGGEEDLFRIEVSLPRVEADLSRAEMVLAWGSVPVLDLLRASVVGLPFGVLEGESSGRGVDRGVPSAVLRVAGVLTLELGVEPETEHFLPARGVGGVVVPLAPSTRKK
jgi:hypothetical protein